jgi:hypothetical protein
MSVGGRELETAKTFVLLPKIKFLNIQKGVIDRPLKKIVEFEN